MHFSSPCYSLFDGTYYRFTLFLILLTLLVLLNGCTIIGNNIGKSIDRSATTMSLVGLSADSCVLDTDDLVMVSLISGLSIEGTVWSITPGDSLTLTVTRSKTVKFPIGQHFPILWQDIHSITKLDRPEKGRLIFTAIGLAVDIFIFEMVTQAMRGLGRSFSSMGA